MNEASSALTADSATPDSSVMVSVSGVTRTFGGGVPVRALRGVSLTIRRGCRSAQPRVRS